MNIRHSCLASCLALLYSSASFAEVNCETLPLIEADITLSQSQVSSTGGYISSQLDIANESCESVKFKYWLSVKGPEGIYFPAKAVVGVDTIQQESVALNIGRMLNVTRGIWIPEYISDGKYTVSLQIVAESGEVFKTEEVFVKGIDPNSLPETDGLTVEVKNQLEISSIESEGGYVPFTVELDNGRETDASVEFWMTAVGPNGLIIPVNSREKMIITARGSYSKARGFTMDKSYPAGEYVINTQVVDVESGKRVETLLVIVKK